MSNEWTQMVEDRMHDDYEELLEEYMESVDANEFMAWMGDTSLSLGKIVDMDTNNKQLLVVIGNAWMQSEEGRWDKFRDWVYNKYQDLEGDSWGIDAEDCGHER